jgi:DNA-binding LacI/PurR family transcriptional regulator
MRQVGARAVTILLDKIAGVRSLATSRPGRHLLRADLLVRQSTAPPR